MYVPIAGVFKFKVSPAQTGALLDNVGVAGVAFTVKVAVLVEQPSVLI